jgi:hypothetical protein
MMREGEVTMLEFFLKPYLMKGMILSHICQLALEDLIELISNYEVRIYVIYITCNDLFLSLLVVTKFRKFTLFQNSREFYNPKY